MRGWELTRIKLAAEFSKPGVTTGAKSIEMHICLLKLFGRVRGADLTEAPGRTGRSFSESVVIPSMTNSTGHRDSRGYFGI